VYVDDTHHHGDQTYRYKVGAFSDCPSAIAACKKIVDEFFATHSSDTAQAQESFDSYRRFGEDPFILTSDKSCVFSAWKYAEQRCQELAAAAIKPDASSWDNPLLNGNGMNLERWASPPSPEIQSGAFPRWTPPACPLPPALPRIISAQPMPPATGSPNHFRFESIIDVPAVMEPAIEARLRKEFREIEWERAENWDKVRLEGISRNAPRYIVVSMARNEPSGRFQFRITIGAGGQSESEKAHNEVIRRLTWALIGWSQLPLPHFKPSPAAGADIDRKEIIELQSLLEGPQITIFQANADILISRTLVEALSLHREVLDPWAKILPREGAGGDDPENRDALLRGAAARVILRQSVSTSAGQDLQALLGLVRPAHALVGELLELGLAQVVLYSPGGRAPGAQSISPGRIKVHYFGSYNSYSAADGEARNLGEFLRLNR
jgi:hypothetical protein